MFSPRTRKAGPNIKLAITECERAFKRNELALAKLHISSVPDPAAIRVIYQPDWDKHCLNPRLVTLLHLAAENGWVNICRDLIQVHKCLPDITDDQGLYTPLHFAIGGSQKMVVEFLLEEQHCDPHCLKFIITPLQLACTIDHTSIVDYLLTVWNCNPNAVDDTFNTPLHYAVTMGHLEVVLSLLATGEIKKLYCNNDGDTVLHIAARMGYCKVLICILSHIEVNMKQCRNNIGDTPLHEAARNGYSEIVRHILLADEDHEDDLSITTNSLGNTPLHEASRFNHTDISQLLLSRKVEQSLLKNCEGDTPLHIACRKGNISTVDLLLINGFDLYAANNVGETPLDIGKPIVCRNQQLRIKRGRGCSYSN